MGERLFCKQEVVGSSPTRSIVAAEVEAVETSVCETEKSEFKSRQPPYPPKAEKRGAVLITQR